MRMGIIGYINTLPLFYPFLSGREGLPGGWEACQETPAALADLFRRHEITVSPVSSVALAWLDNPAVLPDLSISSYGRVMSVLFFYNGSVLDLRRIYVTPESRSSVAMLRVLLSRMKIEKEFVQSDGSGTDNILLIGDRALQAFRHNRFEHVLDIGEEFYRLFGLPSVFSVVVADRSADPDAIRDLHGRLMRWKEEGMKNMDSVIEMAGRRTGLGRELLKEYYSCLSYDLSPDHLEGLRVFFREAYRAGAIDKVPDIDLMEV